MADERVQEGQQGEWELVKDPTGYEFFMGFFLIFFFNEWLWWGLDGYRERHYVVLFIF